MLYFEICIPEERGGEKGTFDPTPVNLSTGTERDYARVSHNLEDCRGLESPDSDEFSALTDIFA